MSEDDLVTVLQWRNSERIRNNMFNDNVITMEEHKSWFQRIKSSPEHCYKIFEKNAKPLGLVYFTEIDRDNLVCDWGFYLGVASLPKGTGLVMGFLGIDFAFNRLGLQKLHGEVLAFNIPSIKFHERLGFVLEYKLLKQIYRNGKYEDVFCFELKNIQWEKICTEIQQIISEENW